jgi:Domain of unknown function (DUF4412)
MRKTITGILILFFSQCLIAQSDTSAAALAMKTLNSMIAGKSISAADSADAIKSFRSASGGRGIVYEFITDINSKQRGTVKDTTMTYFTMSGEGRTEMNLAGMIGLNGGHKLVSLSRISSSRYSITLDESDNTYSLNVIDSSLLNAGGANYTVTKIGEETVNGYHCIHAKLVSEYGTSGFKTTTTHDVWTSSQVPGYAELKKMTANQRVPVKMMRALEQAGVDGAMVKMNLQSREITMSVSLISAKEKTLPASLFIIPSGYKESQQNMFRHMMPAKK